VVKLCLCLTVVKLSRFNSESRFGLSSYLVYILITGGEVLPATQVRE
jgi:hypothetical protein